MAGRIRKCRLCGNPIENNEQSVPYKNGYAHKNCFDTTIKKITQDKKEKLATKKPDRGQKSLKPAKPQKELKEGLSEEEFAEKKQLCSYIRELINEDLSVKIYKLMDDYRKKYKFTFNDMYMDLKYYFEVKENPIEGDAIGIVPYIHDEAQKYYINLKNVQEDCEGKMDSLPSMYQEKRITISAGSKRKVKQIEMSEIKVASEEEQK